LLLSTRKNLAAVDDKRSLWKQNPPVTSLPEKLKNNQPV